MENQALGSQLMYGICGSYLDDKISNEKIKEILTILNGVPLRSAHDIIKEVDRLIHTSLSKVDTSLILPDIVSNTNEK